MGISMENRRMLQFSEPQFKTWSSDNFLISSILSKDTAYDWFMNYYVNTICVVKTDGSNAPPSLLFHPICIPTTSQFLCNIWDLCPFIDKNTLNREIVKTCYPQFSDFVVDSICHNYFIYANFGQSKIRGKKFSHKAYITGYDRDLNEIYLADHIDKGRFQHFKLSFEDLNFAFLEADDYIPFYDEDHQMEQLAIYLIKPKDFKYQFNIELTTQFLTDYLNSVSGSGFYTNIRNTPYRKDEFHFGIKHYQLLESYLLYLINTKDYNAIDFRTFTFLCDHKTVMYKRIEYLIDKKYMKVDLRFLSKLKEIQLLANKCLYLYIKFAFTNNISEIAKMLNHIKKLELLERSFLENLLNSI